MIKQQPYRQRQPSSRFMANHQIRFPEVRVLSDRGEQLGVLSIRDAQAKAREDGKDLVLITDKSTPPVVKIIDLAKFKYQQQQREAEQRKRSRTSDIKEVRFSPFMGSSDFEARLKKVVKFLEKGDKVKLSLQFKGREITKKEFGYGMFAKVIEATSEISKIEMEPKIMGKKLMAQLTPSK